MPALEIELLDIQLVSKDQEGHRGRSHLQGRCDVMETGAEKGERPQNAALGNPSIPRAVWEVPAGGWWGRVGPDRLCGGAVLGAAGSSWDGLFLIVR